MSCIVLHVRKYLHVMLCCNRYESALLFCQKQQALLWLCAERQNSCFSDVDLTVLSPFVSLFCFFYPPLSAWAAESAHQINIEWGIVFRLETAGQVMDNGNSWKCLDGGRKKKARSMKAKPGGSETNLILECKNSPKCLGNNGCFWNDQYPNQGIPHLPETQNINGQSSSLVHWVLQSVSYNHKVSMKHKLYIIT